MMFFQISNTFINWMIKKHLETYSFHMTDDDYPLYEFTVTVERRKIDVKNNN